MKSRKQINLLSLGIVLGAIGGAVAAYFYAPQSGEKTKAMLAKQFNHVTQKGILKIQTGLIQLEQKLEEH